MPRHLHDKADVAANTRDGDHCVGKHPDTDNPACGRGIDSSWPWGGFALPPGKPRRTSCTHPHHHDLTVTGVPPPRPLRYAQS